MSEDIIKQALALKQGEDIVVAVNSDYCDAFDLAVSTEENLRLVQRSALEDEAGNFTHDDYFKAMFEADKQVIKREKMLIAAFTEVLGDAALIDYLKENGVFMQLDTDNHAVRIFRG